MDQRKLLTCLLDFQVISNRLLRRLEKIFIELSVRFFIFKLPISKSNMTNSIYSGNLTNIPRIFVHEILSNFENC